MKQVLRAIVARLDWYRRFPEELFERWDCDMCGRKVWVPLLGRHELRHTDAEWAAAGYDKQGTLAGFDGGSR